MNKIDIVIPWVNPLDSDWQKQRMIFSSENKNDDSRDSRYRDWQNVKYIFRGIEKYCSWVNKVFFISSGVIPSWLNKDCKKLIYLNHSDYIPKKYLPTFSSHPIELNLHRIKELSETFIYFNDDMFITDFIYEDMFFKNNIPIYPAILHSNTSSDKSEIMQYVYLNNNLVINRYFSVDELTKCFSKWFSLSGNGLRAVIENLFNSRYPQIIGFYNSHLPTPLLKSTIAELWEKEEELLVNTSSHKFRNKEDVSQYLFRYWDLARNNFYPINPKKLGKEFDINKENIDNIYESIIHNKYKMICLNDSDEVSNKEFEDDKKIIIEAFEKIFPNKSEYER